jgi:hypothetical protein
MSENEKRYPKGHFMGIGIVRGKEESKSKTP